jgi:CheY-like chemotaxis protein
MKPLHITISNKLSLMILPDSQDYLDGDTILTYTFSIYKNGETKTNEPIIQEAKLHLEKHNNSNYLGYITFEQADHVFTYTADGKNKLTNNEVQEIFELLNHYVAHPKFGPSGEDSFTSKRIIILEDDERILELLETILIDEGYYVTAINQYKPLEYLIDFTPDLILLDVRLADGYGHLLCKDLKANPVTSHIPVVLISGSDNLEEIAKECHADSYLSKPFSVEDLVSVVKQFD